MEVTFPVQKASFRGIYEMVNGVFTPKSLDWFVLTDEEVENTVNFQFENKRGLTLMIVKHNCAFNWICQVLTPKEIVDNPFNLLLGGISANIAYQVNEKQNIIGPFSGSFDLNGITQGELHYNDTMMPGEIMSAAVVCLPHGGI
jgi:hypothetical protein